MNYDKGKGLDNGSYMATFFPVALFVYICGILSLILQGL